MKLTLVTILDNSKWDKINEGIAKNPYLELKGKKRR